MSKRKINLSNVKKGKVPIAINDVFFGSNKILNTTFLVNNHSNLAKFFTGQDQKIDVKGQIINYIKVGNGVKNVLCFPGALGTIWTDFKPQITGFDKKKFTVFAWDPPGYGCSRPPERSFDRKFYHTDADTAYHFMMRLGIKKFSLLGWSDGGISSLILSATHPENIERLIVWGAGSYIVEEEVKTYEKVRNINKWSDKMRSPLVAIYTEKGLQNMWNQWCDAVTNIQKNGGDICRSYLEHIKCPTLILHGNRDPMLADEHPDYLLSHIKNARLYRFRKGKHNIHLKYSEEFNKIVTDFILNPCK